MKGLIWKDLLQLKSYKNTLYIFIICVLILIIKENMTGTPILSIILMSLGFGMFGMASFSYDEQSFNDANQSLLGVWIGKKGATFNIENATIVPEYAKHIVHTNKNDLTWNYNNNNKKILSNLDLNKKSITKNYIGKDSIQIKFDDIYSIKINSDNDEKYELSDNDRFTNKTLNLKLATEENINNLFNVSQRDGFDLEWFSNSNYDVASKINNYTDFVLKSKYDIDVYPKWTLQK